MKRGIGAAVSAKQIAYCAVMTAILIGGQMALASVSGVEVVTVLLCSFAFIFGARAGVLTAAAFALLRCFIWGFYPSVIILYLIYYPTFALIFGYLGGVKHTTYENLPVWTVVAVNIVLAAVMVFCALFAAGDFLKISRLSKTLVVTLLWVIFALAAALLIVFDGLYVARKAGKLKSGDTIKLVLVTAVAAVCTICFTLLDDVITPLVLGWKLSSVTTAAYFYSSFLALAPQTVCTIVTVSTLFLPLTAIFKKVKKC